MANVDRLMPLIVPFLRGVTRVTQKARRTQIAELPTASDRVLFLGDSITELAMWDEWFPELPTLNRGIGGETVAEVIQRVETSIIAPRAISLLIGTNDLSGLGQSRKIEVIAQDMRALVKAIKARSGATPLFINGVMPRSAFFTVRIRALNDHYKAIAADAGATYIDTCAALAGEDGAIRPEFTADGIHLTGSGYRAWTDLLRPHLAPFG